MPHIHCTVVGLFGGVHYLRDLVGESGRVLVNKIIPEAHIEEAHEGDVHPISVTLSLLRVVHVDVGICHPQLRCVIDNDAFTETPE